MVSLGVHRHPARWTRANVTLGRPTMPIRIRILAAITIQLRSRTCITARKEITIRNITTIWHWRPPCHTWPVIIWIQQAATTWPLRRSPMVIYYLTRSIRRWYSGLAETLAFFIALRKLHLLDPLPLIIRSRIFMQISWHLKIRKVYTRYIRDSSFVVI